MTSELFVKIMLSIITICGALISAYVVPYVNSRIGAEKLAILENYVRVAVRCAEQVFSKEQWQDKKLYVTTVARDFINTKLGIELSETELDTIIEGIVNEIKH